MRGSETGARRGEAGFWRLLVLQAVLCALICGGALALLRLRPAAFDALREQFAAAAERDLLPETFTFFPPTEPEETEAPQTTETETTEPGQTAPGQTQPEQSVEPESGPAAAGLSMRTSAETPAQPVAGTVTSDYGERIHPVYGTASFHEGRDIAAEEGSPICAVLSGTVAGVGVGELSGNYVRIDHGDGTETFYCHCARVCVSEGETVRRGDVIAYVGQTGCATGPHLHFELRVNGEKRDPAALLDPARRDT